MIILGIVRNNNNNNSSNNKIIGWCIIWLYTVYVWFWKKKEKLPESQYYVKSINLIYFQNVFIFSNGLAYIRIRS